jgi:hypothetical protein
VALLVVSVFVIVYIVRTLVRLLTWSATVKAQSQVDSAGAVAGIVSIGCCGSAPTRVTLNLL